MKKLYVSEFRSPGGNEKTEELKALFGRVRETAPAVRFCPARDPFPADERIKAIRFSGLSNGEKENSVFAYIGFPENASEAAPVPGMVLVHGGGGHARAAGCTARAESLAEMETILIREVGDRLKK